MQGAQGDMQGAQGGTGTWITREHRMYGLQCWIGEEEGVVLHRRAFCYAPHTSM